MRCGELLRLWRSRRTFPIMTTVPMDSTRWQLKVFALRGHSNTVPTSTTSTTSTTIGTPIVSEDDHKLVPNTNSNKGFDVKLPLNTSETEATKEGHRTSPPPPPPFSKEEKENDYQGNPSQYQSQYQSTSTSTRIEKSSTSGYAPWEIRALLLPLIPAGGATIPLRDVIPLLPKAAGEEMRSEGSPLAYIQRHFADDIIVKGTELTRRALVINNNNNTHNTNINNNTGLRGNRRREAAPPPPPPPPPVPSASANQTGTNNSSHITGNSSGSRTPLEVLDNLVEFIPTFFVQPQMVADLLPSEITKQFADTSFLFYIKRFRHYIDIRAHHGNTEIRLRPDFAHPKRGVADTRYTSGISGSDMMSQLARGRRPPRNSEANLIHFIVPRMPTSYTPIATVLQDVSDIVSRHPSFDPRLGVTGLFEKYPEYFQIVDAKLRVRPFRSAPNSLDDCNATTSPLPVIYAKIKSLVDEYAEGKDYSVETEKAAAIVPTGKLYALLTNAEKMEVKAKCRSFPRFLRLHGEDIVVSIDNMKVYQFRPTYEKCAETIMDQRLTMNSLSPDDPVLKIPASMDDNTSADWAVRELYDALPLMQCAELEEVMSLVPPSVKNALPQEQDKLIEHLALYPDYFSTWPYPDNPTVIVVQRAKLELLALQAEDIARMVLPLIPQGGIEAAKLLTRVPLPLQRHFYRHGLKKVLGEMKNYFLVIGDKIMRVG